MMYEQPLPLSTIPLPGEFRPKHRLRRTDPQLSAAAYARITLSWLPFSRFIALLFLFLALCVWDCG
ncbi:hypothetical protein GCM10010918_44640 [Paenibacillus radicis (ex Gao et al. 2016)]|uniref:Uncharacterized protein n=1 Tax=Paenibacillus radicis (ex Gao et al. 2016) TaxID=1737354 RepID=A0A917HLE6_9BACL|nr:hypothetical protein GCM10010918_44640 [Paenibacillus radicis (ex Gao et al. 2016)]